MDCATLFQVSFLPAPSDCGHSALLLPNGAPTLLISVPLDVLVAFELSATMKLKIDHRTSLFEPVLSCFFLR